MHVLFVSSTLIPTENMKENIRCFAAQAMAAICGSLATGMTVLPILAVPLMVFGGFMISYDAIPTYFKPLAYVSWYKYGFEAITIIYFRHEQQISGCSNPTSVSSLISSNSSIESLEETCSSGINYIESQAFSVSNLYLDYAVIVAALVFWKIVGVVAFTVRCRAN